MYSRNESGYPSHPEHVNYWHYPKLHGTNSPKLEAVTKKPGLLSKLVFQIVVILTCILLVAVFVVQVNTSAVLARGLNTTSDLPNTTSTTTNPTVSTTTTTTFSSPTTTTTPNTKL